MPKMKICPNCLATYYEYEHHDLIDCVKRLHSLIKELQKEVIELKGKVKLHDQVIDWGR